MSFKWYFTTSEEFSKPSHPQFKKWAVYCCWAKSTKDASTEGYVVWSKTCSQPCTRRWLGLYKKGTCEAQRISKHAPEDVRMVIMADSTAVFNEWGECPEGGRTPTLRIRTVYEGL